MTQAGCRGLRTVATPWPIAAAGIKPTRGEISSWGGQLASSKVNRVPIEVVGGLAAHAAQADQIGGASACPASDAANAICHGGPPA